MICPRPSISSPEEPGRLCVLASCSASRSLQRSVRLLEFVFFSVCVFFYLFKCKDGAALGSPPASLLAGRCLPGWDPGLVAAMPPWIELQREAGGDGGGSPRAVARLAGWMEQAEGPLPLLEVTAGLWKCSRGHGGASRSVPIPCN